MGNRGPGVASWLPDINLPVLLEAGQGNQGSLDFSLHSLVPHATAWTRSREHSGQCGSSGGNWLLVGLHVLTILEAKGDLLINRTRAARGRLRTIAQIRNATAKLSSAAALEHMGVAVRSRAGTSDSRIRRESNVASNRSRESRLTSCQTSFGRKDRGSRVVRLDRRAQGPPCAY